jgi:inosine-uridine nucleoside N-ribohydrolase
LERAEHPVSPLMYDQIAVLSLLEPSVIARVEEMWLDVEIDHGASYGAMLFWDQDRVPPTDVRAGRVQIDLDYRRFVETFIKLMRRPVRSPDAQ